jgi:putative sporulation protein YyaC
MSISTPCISDSIDINCNFSSINLSMLLIKYFQQYSSPNYSNLIFLCIGTDRSTGDSLGPLIGHKLSNSPLKYNNTHIYGTLKDPVHAKNLEENINTIHANYEQPFIVAVDACLGKMDRIGHVTVGRGPLRPGAGVNKQLPSIGHLHIMGIVNLGGYMEYMILQNTRLNLVMKMADTISEGIKFSLWKLNKQKLLFQ